MPSAVTIGRVIQKCRERKKLSQEVVSGLAGIGRTHLSAIERGVRRPTLDTFFKLADAMGIPPDELVRQIVQEAKKDADK